MDGIESKDEKKFKIRFFPVVYDAFKSEQKTTRANINRFKIFSWRFPLFTLDTNFKEVLRLIEPVRCLISSENTGSISIKWNRYDQSRTNAG